MGGTSIVVRKVLRICIRDKGHLIQLKEFILTLLIENKQLLLYFLVKRCFKTKSEKVVSQVNNNTNTLPSKVISTKSTNNTLKGIIQMKALSKIQHKVKHPHS